MATKNDIIGVRSFVLITGASRGFGRALALELGKVVGAGSTLLLMARSMADLETTKAIVRDARPGLAVELVSIDLETANQEAFEKAVRDNYGRGDHSVAMVIHNAGTLGQDGRKITVRKYIFCVTFIYSFYNNLKSAILKLRTIQLKSL